MKKFKFLSMALAALALASCTSDDLDAVGNYELADDGTEVFATINEDVDGTMRAGFATATTDVTNIKFGQKAYFMKGDQFKMYCKDTWMPQVYEFTKNAVIDGVNGSVFTWADEESKYNNVTADMLANREYGVFPAKAFEFKDEFRETLYFKLTSPLVYGEYKGVADAIEDEARPVYKAEVPMFGQLKDNKIIFNYMTALIRVQMYGMKTGKEYTMTLTSTGDEKYKLSGEFESDKDFHAYDGTNVTLPVFNVTTADADKPTEQSLVLTFTPQEADGVVYLPLPVGEYKLNQLELSYTVEGDKVLDQDETLNKHKITLYTLDTNEDGTRKACSEYTEPVTLKAGLRLISVEEKNVAVTVNDLKTLNDLLEEWADYGRDVKVDVTLGDNIEVVPTTVNNGDYEYELKDGEKGTKLIIPDLKNNVTLNIIAGDYKFVSSTEYPVYIFPIEDAKEVTNKTNKLTLKNVATDLPVEVKTQQGLALDGQLESTLTVNQAGALDLAGSFAEAVTVVEARDVTLAGEFSENVTVGTEALAVGDVVFTGKTVKNLTVYASNFEGKGTFPACTNGEKTVVTADGTITLASTATWGKFETYGNADVEVVDKVTIYILNIYGNGQVNVKGKVTSLNMFEGATVNVTGAVTTLTVKEDVANATVNLSENGSIEKLDNSKDAGVTVTTSDAAVIKTVTDAEDAKKPTEITANWTEKTTAALEDADINSGNIYTALQLAALQTENTVTTFNLYADVVANDVVWTSSQALANGGTFNGNDHSITGLKVVNGSKNYAGFFKTVQGTTTIKNLTLTGVSVDGKKKEGLTDGIGGLVGRANAGNLTIEGVTLSGSIEADNSNNVGGLVGTNVGTITIKDSKVTLDKISGTGRLGGFVGIVGADASVIVENTKASSVEIKNIVVTGSPKVATTDAAVAGTVGMYVGMLQKATSKLTVDAKTTATDSYGIRNHFDALHFSDVKKTDYNGQVTLIYVGQHEGNYVGYSPVYGDGNAQIGETIYVADTEKANALNYYEVVNK